MSLMFDGKSQCLSITGLPVGSLILTIELEDCLDSRQTGCLCDSRYPFGVGSSVIKMSTKYQNTKTLILNVNCSGSIILFSNWKQQNPIRVVVNSVSIQSSDNNVIRQYNFNNFVSNYIPNQLGDNPAELHGFSFNAIPNWADWGYWYVCKAVQDADGGWSAPAIGGAGWCGWYADIWGVKYVAVRLPQPRTDVPTTDAVTLAQVLSGYSGTPYGRVGG